MLDLNDERWRQVEGGYRTRYDPRPALARLEQGVDIDAAWAELWEELYHQGDVGTASYAAVPHLVRVHRARNLADWNTYGIVGAIDQARMIERNSPVPSWLADGYEMAWRELPALALSDLSRSADPTLTQSALGVVAIARGLRCVGEVLLDFTNDELGEMVLEYRDGTSQ